MTRCLTMLFLSLLLEPYFELVIHVVGY